MGNIYDVLPELRQQAVDAYFKPILQPIEGFIGQSKILPIKEYNRDEVWYRVYDSPTGLMLPADPDAPAPKIAPKGMSEESFKGYNFKEAKIFGAKDINYLQQCTPDLRDEYLINAIDQLIVRAKTRIEQMIWSAFTGTLSVTGNGLNYTKAYPVQTATTTASWKTATTNILADLVINAKKIKAYGGQCKYIVMNSTTFANTFGINNYFQDKMKYGGFLYEIGTITQIIQQKPELQGTQIVIYDEGYIPDGSSSVTLFVPDDVVFYIGGSTNFGLGEFQLVRDPNSVALGGEAKPGFWDRSIEHTESDPYGVEVLYGFTGAPAIVFPKWVVYDSNIAS
ncbi:MAG: hypothetical protein GYA14_14035 [Ignavibacteria bacterium]|nr:hypothetical protein [Ignavibacteria bacterium]